MTNAENRFGLVQLDPFVKEKGISSEEGLLGKDKFNQVKGYKTIAQSPIRSGSSLLPTCHSAPIGTSRGLHAGRALSGPAVNHPLSPYLPLKKPQFSATFSIPHRIFGMALGTAIMLTPLAYKFSLQFDV